MVRACVAWEGEVISNVVFTGDFFMEPPDLIDSLGKHLTETPSTEVRGRVASFFEKNEVTLFGVEPADFSTVVLRAIHEGH